MTSKKSYVFLDDILPADSENNLPFPQIYDSPYAHGSVPSGFNAVVINLNGRADASLDWRVAKQAANEYIKNGFNIFWQLDLGLFDQTTTSLSDQQHFMSLSLSIQHFKETLWKDFYANTLGLSLYKGLLDSSRYFIWDEKQTLNFQDWLHDYFSDIDSLNNAIGSKLLGFNQIDSKYFEGSVVGNQLMALYCNDVAVDYMEQLAKQFPGELPVCALFKVNDKMDPLLQTLLSSKERFDRIHRAITSNGLPVEVFTQQSAGVLSQELISVPITNKPSLGICVPSREIALSTYLEPLKQILQKAISLNKPFRLIPEMVMTTEWDGIDHMFVIPEALSSQGIRKLRGFCAAGGTVVLAHASETLSFLPSVQFWEDYSQGT